LKRNCWFACCITLARKFPDSKILVLEKECCHKERVLKTLVLLVWKSFKIIDDLKSHSEEEVIQLIQNGGKVTVVA
jgi:hypothetical protein